jgi:hypothetical protein
MGMENRPIVNMHQKFLAKSDKIYYTIFAQEEIQ